MATGGRKNVPQLLHELSATLSVGQVNAAAPIALGVLPAGAILHGYRFVTSQAFDATTVTLGLGFTAGGFQIVTAVSVKAQARIDAMVVNGATGFYLSDTTIWATPALTGGPNTVGSVTVVLEYLPGLG